MTRDLGFFDCEGSRCAYSLDRPEGAEPAVGLLIVGGGNELRSGAHGGMARLAGAIAARGFPVLRFDRRGVGDSEGVNRGFLSSEADLTAAARHFRALRPELRQIFGFGNCDAATALALFYRTAGLGALALANPWVIDEDADAPPSPSPRAIRQRYWRRLRDPALLGDLLGNRVDWRKLGCGLRKSVGSAPSGPLAGRLMGALGEAECPITVLLATGDRTAGAYIDAAQRAPLSRTVVERRHDSASHSFSSHHARDWLTEALVDMLTEAASFGGE